MKDKKGYIKWIVFLVINTLVVFSWIIIRFYYKFIDANIKIDIPFAMDFLPTFVLSALFSITDKVNIKKKLINFFYEDNNRNVCSICGVCIICILIC